VCQLCKEATAKSRMRLTDTHIVLVFESFDFMVFDKKLFEGTPINKYEELIEKLLKGPNEWKEKTDQTLETGSVERIGLRKEAKE